MFLSSVRARMFVVVAALAVSCSSSPPEAVEISPDDVVLAYVDSGMNAEVADCLVGLGSREFDLNALLPGAAAQEDALLLDEMLRSCNEAVAALSEEDLEARINFETGPFNIGDDLYLDDLWTGCSRGDGADCDQLWMESPVGSIYESYGVSCGNRPEILDCTEEMNGPDVTPDAVN